MPDDPDLRVLEPNLQGTALLAQAALSSLPPGQAEAESRREVEKLMQDAALRPKVLREAIREQPHRPWWRRFLTKGH